MATNAIMSVAGRRRGIPRKKASDRGSRRSLAGAPAAGPVPGDGTMAPNTATMIVPTSVRQKLMVPIAAPR